MAFIPGHAYMQASRLLFSQLSSVATGSPAQQLDSSLACMTWQYWCLLSLSATLEAKVINQDGLASVSSSRELVYL